MGWRKVTLSVVAVAGIGFMTMAAWTRSLPNIHGATWTLRHTLVRLGAIATGVVLLVGTVVALVPWVLDRFERGSFISYVAARHVRAQKSGFLTLISGLAIFAVALASLLAFERDQRDGWLQRRPQVEDPRKQRAHRRRHDEPVCVGRLRADARARSRRAGVLGATPVAKGEVMVSSASNLAGVIVHGIDPATIGSVIDLRKNVEAPVHVEDKLAYLENPELLTHISAR